MRSADWQVLLGPAATSIRAVLFDAVGTLIAPTTPVPEAYAALGQRHGSRLDAAQVAARFPQAFRGANSAHGRSDEQIERARWRSIVRHVFVDLADTTALFEALWTHFALPSSWRLVPGAAELLNYLVTADFVIGVASNFDARLFQVLSGANRLPPGVNFFVSSDLGWQKPQPGFFRAVERSLDLLPEQFLLIGDDWENDVVGARKAGWQAIWVAREMPPGMPETPRVASLAELLD